MDLIATILFALAVLHTFCVSLFAKMAHRFRSGSIGENLFHFLSEVEVVFGIWAAVFIAIFAMHRGRDEALHFLESVNYTEPIFVFVIMCMSATRPILSATNVAIGAVSKLFPGNKRTVRYCVTLILGPLLGSLITEPAAMTVTALLLRDNTFAGERNNAFKYATLALLFINVSIGGTLTHFAAPPVLMVASAWQWNTPFMLTTFGWRAAIAILFATLITAFIFRNVFEGGVQNENVAPPQSRWWLFAVHASFVFLAVAFSHYVVVFIPVFLFFLGWCSVSKEYQDDLQIRPALLVGFFLGGLVTLGGLQKWWIQPLISQLNEVGLFWGATTLTAVSDNAAITYLGTLVTNLSDVAKYALVAGAVTGGGLTVIANAPNPVGYGILGPEFGEDGIDPIKLFFAAVPYMLLVALAFLL